jgi:release factor glutamine methyltransferase
VRHPVDGGALWIAQLTMCFVLGSLVTASIPASAIADAIVRLRAAGCVFAEDEAAVLSAAASDEATLSKLVGRRADGEPLEQVVGYADFCGLRVRLRPGVFVPRVRSELLVRRGAQAASTEAEPVVIDLCCGSGALGLAVRHYVPGIDLYAADLDPVAVTCARHNFGPNRDRVLQGDLFNPLPAQLKGKVNVLLANVPYVATRHLSLLPAEARDHEPPTALDGGDDGLDIFRDVIDQAPHWLAPGGIVLSEITEAQIDAATAAVRTAGLEPEVTSDEDLEATIIGGRR